MKIVRFNESKNIHVRYGELVDQSVLEIDGSPYDGVRRSGRSYPLESVKLHVPCEPTNVIAAGANYMDHIREVGIKPLSEPIFFIKPTSSLAAQGDPIEYPPQSRRVDYEGELAVVIKRPLRRAAESAVLESILGYTCANDVTARDIQNDQGNLIRVTHAKAFDTFCPVGPWLVTDLDTSALDIKTIVNGVTKQAGNTKNMLFGIAALISYFSHVMTLAAGDVILTGTPAGIGPVQPGDEVSVSIQGIGVLTNPVVTRPTAKG